jgi:hypothetical protein
MAARRRVPQDLTLTRLVGIRETAPQHSLPPLRALGLGLGWVRAAGGASYANVRGRAALTARGLGRVQQLQRPAFPARGVGQTRVGVLWNGAVRIGSPATWRTSPCSTRLLHHRRPPDAVGGCRNSRWRLCTTAWLDEY